MKVLWFGLLFASIFANRVDYSNFDDDLTEESNVHYNSYEQPYSEMEEDYEDDGEEEQDYISIEEFQSGKATEIDQPTFAFQSLYQNGIKQPIQTFDDDDQTVEDGSESYDDSPSTSDDVRDYEGEDPTVEFDDDKEGDAEEDFDDDPEEAAAEAAETSPSSTTAAAAKATTTASTSTSTAVPNSSAIAKQAQAQITQNLRNHVSKFLSGSTSVIGNSTMNSDGTIKTTPYTTGAAIVLIVIGVFMLVFGQRAFKAIMFIFGFLFFGAVGFFVLSYLRANNIVNISNNTTWIYVGVIAGSGLVGGGLFLCCVNIASFLFGAALGAIIAVFFNSIPMITALNTNVRIGIIAGWIVLGIIFGYFVRKPLLILMTSFVGSYSMFCGIDFFLRSGFYSLLFKLRTGQASTIAWGLKLYVMAGGFLLVAIVGSIVQFQLDKKNREVKYQPAPTKQV